MSKKIAPAPKKAAPAPPRLVARPAPRGVRRANRFPVHIPEAPVVEYAVNTTVVAQPRPQVDGPGPMSYIVYVDHDGGVTKPSAHGAPAPRAFQILVGGKTYVHTFTRPDGAWVYYPVEKP